MPNSGRMAELLVPGAELMVAPAPEGRATACTLELVRYGDQWVCVHAVRANRLAQEALEQGLIEPGATEIRREVAMGGSRVDLAYRMGGQACFLEVKSVTLIRSGWACFPDAPPPGGQAFAGAGGPGCPGEPGGRAVRHRASGGPGFRAQLRHRSRFCPGAVLGAGAGGMGRGPQIRYPRGDGPLPGGSLHLEAGDFPLEREYKFDCQDEFCGRCSHGRRPIPAWIPD